MGRRLYNQDQIIDFLREAQRRLTQGESLSSICKSLGISQSSYREWKRKYSEHTSSRDPSASTLPEHAIFPHMSAHRWNVIFWSTFFTIILITSLYPIGLYLTISDKQYGWEVWRSDLAWSFHGWCLIPIAFGLLATAFSFDLFKRLSILAKTVWTLVFLLPMAPVYYAAFVNDTQPIPSPDRISQIHEQQQNAIKIDRCIRDQQGCKEREKYLSLVPNCIKEYSGKNSSYGFGPLKQQNRAYEKSQSYICALLEKFDGKIRMGPMNVIIKGLKIILITFVWCYLYYILFLGCNYFFEVSPRILYSLIGCLVIFTIWLPLQMFAEWYHWYGDISHMGPNYTPAYIAFVVLAILLIFLFVVWVRAAIHRVDISTLVGTSHSTIAVIATAILAFNPDLIKRVFSIFGELPIAMLVLLLFVVFMYVFILTRSIIAFSSVEASRQVET